MSGCVKQSTFYFGSNNSCYLSNFPEYNLAYITKVQGYDTDSICRINGCILFPNLTNLDRSRFVRGDRSIPVKRTRRSFWS